MLPYLLIGVAFVIVATYIGFLCHLIKGVPSSISETYYRGGQGWFTAVMVAAGFLVAIGEVHITPEPWQFLGFLQGAGLIFVGVAAQFKSPSVRPVHVAAALIFGIASQAWVALVASPFLLLTWLLWPCCYHTPVRTFVAEALCIINIVSATIVIYLS